MDPTLGRGVFTGATVPSVTSIALDPAALGLGTLDEAYAAATLEVDREAISTQTTSVHDTEAAAGGIVGMLFHFKQGEYSIAWSVDTTPVATFPTNHTALQYQILGGGERAWPVTVGGAYRVADAVHFGLSLASDFRDLQLQYARDAALAQGNGPGGVTSACGSSACGVGNPLATEYYNINVRTPYVSVDTLVVNLGFVIQLPGKDTFLAIAGHEPLGNSLTTSLSGTMDVTQAPRAGGDVIHGGATVNIAEPLSADVEFRTRVASGMRDWPGPLDLHVGATMEDLSRLQAYDVRSYGATLADAGIPEVTDKTFGFHIPFAMWAGVEQVDSGQPLRVGARLGYETSSVSNEQTSAMAIDPPSFTFDVGAQLRLSPDWVVQLTYGLQYYEPVTVTRSWFDPNNQIGCTASGFDYASEACGLVRGGYGIASADGSYDRVLHAARVALRLTF
jgi:hypothetical protein